jgi:CHAT domain-containing protein/tetratricopeptide (TPR) repeat protein
MNASFRKDCGPACDRRSRWTRIGNGAPVLVAALLTMLPILARGSADEADVYSLSADVVRLNGEGRHDEAIPLAERAVALAEEALGSEHPDLAATLANLASAYYGKGQYARAKPLLERSLAIFEKALEPEHLGVAMSLHNLASLYRALGDYARAEPLFERSISIRENALGPNHPEVARSLHEFAALYFETADYARAEALIGRSLAIREKVHGPEHLEVALSLNSLAELFRAKGNYARAVPVYERSLAIFEKALGSDHRYVAVALSNLAVVNYSKGDYARAETLYERSLAISEKALGSEHVDRAVPLNGLASLYRKKGDYARAETLYEQSLAIWENALGPEHPYVSTALSNLAGLYRVKGDYARAEPLYERSLAIAEKVLGPEHPDVGRTLNSLAFLYHAGGDDGRAAPLYERSLAIIERTLGPEHPSVADPVGNLAWLYHAKGDDERAESLHARALAIAERQIQILLPTGSEAQARAYMATLKWQTDTMVSFQRMRPDAPSMTRLALTTVLRRKGRVLDVVSGGVATLRSRVGSEERALLDALLERRAALAKLILRGRGTTDPEIHREALAKMRSEVETLERQALRRGGQLQAIATPVEIAGVQARIPSDAALVEMVRYREFDPTPPPGDTRWGAAQFGAFVLRAEGDPVWTTLGEAKLVVESVDAFRAALVNRTLTTARFREHAMKLYARVLGPLEQHLKGVNTVLLAPDGVLNLVPFGALVGADDGYLIERFDISYLTSGRDLLRIDARNSESSEPLVFADPKFDEAQGGDSGGTEREPARRSRDIGQLRFHPLPGTRQEAAAIGTSLGVVPRTAGHASEAAVRARRAPQILHIATHGFFLADQPEPMPSGRMGPMISVADESASGPNLTTENPMLRSGLALAGANARSESGDDGLLTALEMSGLDLWGTDLVVLSACETAVGQPSIGEGVYGLRRALVIAGARTQLASLWKVDDLATLELMTAYYGRLKEGRGRAEALRDVQLEMLRSSKWNHAYYWASFIPIGARGAIEFGPKATAAN